MLFTYNGILPPGRPGDPISLFGYPGTFDAEGRATVDVPAALAETETAAGRLKPLAAPWASEPDESAESQTPPRRVRARK